MANPLSNEKELYDRIRAEGIGMETAVWDLIYNKIGDAVSAINLLCQYYLLNQEAIPVCDAQKILSYVRHIKDIVRDITAVKSGKAYFPEIKGNSPLHPVIVDLFTHHVNNDLNIINLALYDCTAAGVEKAIPARHIETILAHTRMIRDFLEKLSRATLRV
jgi:hypothetical protein